MNSVWVVGKRSEEFKEKYIIPARKIFKERGFEIDPENPELVVAIGGDGTLLRAVKDYSHSLILGVRKESRGSLCAIEYEEIEKAVEKLERGEYKIEKEFMVELEYEDDVIKGINEVYFIRDTWYYLGANRFRVYKDDEDIYGDEIYGDGALLATHLGSTGYSWNYGGPKVKSGEFVFTPMAASCLNKRDDSGGPLRAKPFIIKEEDEVFIEITRDAKNILCADSSMKLRRDLKMDDEVILRPSKDFVKFLKFGKY